MSIIKKILLTATLLLLPSAVSAQQFGRLPPLDSADVRLEYARPLAESVIKGDLSAAEKVVITLQPDAAKREKVMRTVKELIAEFGGGTYKVTGFLSGRGRDVIIEIASEATGAAGFGLLFDQQSGELMMLAPIQPVGG